MPSTRSSGRSSRSSCAHYPDIKVEIIIDYGLTDIVAERYRRRRSRRRAGGEGHDRRAHRPGHAHGGRRRAVVFRKAAGTEDAAGPDGHDCINLRLPTYGGLYAWEFEKGGRELKVRVEGQLVFNGTFQMLNAALAGFGLAYVPEDLVQPHLAKGRLMRVLADWCPPFSGYHLYYPSRRQSSAAFALLVDALRYRR